MYNFVTLFDKNYLSRGIALYHSLVKHCHNFSLYILALDTETENSLPKKLNNYCSIIPLNELESCYPELSSLKKERSRAEYCWTLTPYSIQYVIKKFNLDSCTYLDSDIFFFNSPNIILDAANDYSIIITEHRYTPEYDQTKTSGKYCVQFISFKNDDCGTEALEWWRLRCKEWCYARCEDNKFGDQKYLDDWTTRFKNVYVPTHIGCGLAPWNIQQYDLFIQDNTLYAQDKVTKKEEPVIFYHFHGLKTVHANTDSDTLSLSSYIFDSTVIKYVYSDYINLLYKGKDIHIDFTEQKQKMLFFSIISLVLKDIVKNMFFIKKYRYYKKLLEEKHRSKTANTLIVYLTDTRKKEQG